MAHPYAKFRQSNVERSRVGEIAKDYKRGGGVKGTLGKALTAHRAEHEAMGIDGEHAKHRADRPRRASGGKVGKKATTVVNVITGGQQQPPAPPPMPPAPPPMPPGPPSGAALPPGGPMPGPGPGVPPGPPGPPMRAKGGGVKSVGMNVGTHVQHDDAKAVEKKNLHRPRVVTFASGGKVKSFRAYANGGTLKDVAPATKLPGGAGGGEGRLAKIKKY